MSKTALQLLEELGKRRRDLILSTPSSAGTVTTLVDAELAFYIPRSAQQTYGWVYGRQDVAAGNRGQQARADHWDLGTSTLHLVSPGLPVATTTAGTYEIHLRSERSRKLEALNEAIGMLGLSWHRQVRDDSLTGIASQWIYTLPSSANWTRVVAVDIQASTAGDLVGYPYSPGDRLNWKAYRTVDTSGTVVWRLQFEEQPPAGYGIRVWGEAYYPDLAADTDVLALGGDWERPALAWIMDYAQFFLTGEDLAVQPSAATEKILAERQMHLMDRQEKLLTLAPPHQPSRIVTPRVGTGTLRYRRPNLSEFGIFSWGE